MCNSIVESLEVTGGYYHKMYYFILEGSSVLVLSARNSKHDTNPGFVPVASFVENKSDNVESIADLHCPPPTVNMDRKLWKFSLASCEGKHLNSIHCWVRMS
jgi:hypothetical protein